MDPLPRYFSEASIGQRRSQVSTDLVSVGTSRRLGAGIQGMAHERSAFLVHWRHSGISVLVLATGSDALMYRSFISECPAPFDATCPRCNAGILSTGKCLSCGLQMPGFSLNKGALYAEPAARLGPHRLPRPQKAEASILCADRRGNDPRHAVRVSTSDRPEGIG